ncbi:hypothetical protein D3C81_1897280 [compost metagenome]
MIEHAPGIGVMMAFAGRKLLYEAGVAADGLEVEPIKLRFGEGRVLPDAFEQLSPVIGGE